MTCPRCDRLLDELNRLRAELDIAARRLVAERETSSELRWERDHAIEAYHGARDALAELQLAVVDAAGRKENPR